MPELSERDPLCTRITETTAVMVPTRAMRGAQRRGLTEELELSRHHRDEEQQHGDVAWTEPTSTPPRGTHGYSRLHCVLSGCVFFAYCVFADKHSTHRNFECAGALCSVYCVFGCQFVFTPPEILSAVVYCVLRIAYPVHHFESGCVLVLSLN